MTSQNQVLLYLCIVVFIFGGFIGGIIGYKMKQCPVVVGTHSDTTSVKPKDTLHSSVTGDSIKVTKKPVHKPVAKPTVPSVVAVADTAHPDTAKPVDSGDTHDHATVLTTCYSVEKLQKDSANIKVDVCSDSLPEKKPIDLTFNIDYYPPPKQVITNTVTVEKAMPLIKDWRAYLLALAMAGLGYLAHGR